MTQELTEIEFKKTFGNGMTDITESEIDEPIDIWNYVKKLTENQIVDRIVYEKELVKKVYRNDLKTFDHILLPTEKQNVFLTIVVDLEKKIIFGHKILDLNKEYGIAKASAKPKINAYKPVTDGYTLPLCGIKTTNQTYKIQ